MFADEALVAAQQDPCAVQRIRPAAICGHEVVLRAVGQVSLQRSGDRHLAKTQHPRRAQFCASPGVAQPAFVSNAQVGAGVGVEAQAAVRVREDRAREGCCEGVDCGGETV